MRTCLLHAGVAKTGTTVIQGFLEERRRDVESRGLGLPTLGRLDLVEAGRALAMDLREERDPAAPTTDSWRALDAYLSRSDGDFCISRESFGQSLSRKAGAAFVLGFFAERGIRLRVVVFVRDTADFINSAYAQNAKRLRLTQPFEAWADDALAAGDPRFSVWLMFRRLIVSGQAEVVARPFGASGRGPLPDFLEAIGREDIDTDGFDDAPYRNASPGPKVIAAGVELGRALADKRKSPGVLVRYAEVFEAAVERRGWREAPFNGPDEALADGIAAHFGADDDRFARAMWGVRWSDRVPRRRRPRHVLDLDAASRADRDDVADLVKETLARGARRELWRGAISLGGLLRRA